MALGELVWSNDGAVLNYTAAILHEDDETAPRDWRSIAINPGYRSESANTDGSIPAP